jgi:hypothetical protein
MVTYRGDYVITMSNFFEDDQYKMISSFFMNRWLKLKDH